MECSHYADKLNTGSGQKLKQQYRDWAKTVKKEGGAFFKTVKDKVSYINKVLNVWCVNRSYFLLVMFGDEYLFAMCY